jgi:hypothetical protein
MAGFTRMRKGNPIPTAPALSLTRMVIHIRFIIHDLSFANKSPGVHTFLY